MEVSDGDDTTDIVNKEFKNFKFLDEDYLDAMILFGYKEVNCKYVMVKVSEIKDYHFNEDEDVDIDISVGIDINGFEDNDSIKRGEVISFFIHKVN